MSLPCIYCGRSPVYPPMQYDLEWVCRCGNWNLTFYGGLKDFSAPDEGAISRPSPGSVVSAIRSSEQPPSGKSEEGAT